MKQNHPPPPSHSSLEKRLSSLLTLTHKKPITLGFLLQTLSHQGSCLTLIFLTLPFCQPIVLPGLSTVFGFFIVLSGFNIMFQKNLWLPKRLSKHTLSQSLIKKIITKTLWVMKKINPFFRKRLTLFVLSPFFRILNGLLIIILGLFLALPLPIPFTNLIPGWIIFFIAVGLLKEDGLFVILGYTLLGLSLCLTLFVGMTLLKSS